MHTFCTFLILARLPAFISTWLHMTVCYDNMQERNPARWNIPKSTLEFITKPQLNVAFGTFELSLTEPLLAPTLEEFTTCLEHFC